MTKPRARFRITSVSGAIGFAGAFCAVLVVPVFVHGQTKGAISAGASQNLQQLAQSMHPYSPSAIHSSASVAPEGLAEMKLVPGSSVNLHVYEEPDLDGSYLLDNTGNISIPLAGSIHLESLTLREAESAVNAKLVSTEILTDPHVVVNIDEYSAKSVTVSGEVTSPGRYPELLSHPLVDVLAKAGGETPMAGSEIVIHRANQPPDVTETVHYSPSAKDNEASKVEINPGDSITVQKAGVVYVLGAVNRPGGYIMQDEGSLTAEAALALAYGTAPQAAINKIRVIRKCGDGTCMLEIGAQYDKFRKGQAAPLQLQAGDVVFVPYNVLTSLWDQVKGVAGSAASAVIYVYR